MGKYSLEHYEKYKVYRFRPQEDEAAGKDADWLCFKTESIVLGGEKPKLTGATLLLVKIPSEMSICMPETESMLRSLAADYYRHPLVLGVTLESEMSEEKNRRLWEIAALAFAPKRYYVSVCDGAQLSYMFFHGLMRGLYVPVGDNIYDTCEAFAQNNAQKLYKQMPVLVSFRSETEHDAYAEGWHAQAVEGAKVDVGWCIALRRLMMPRVVTSGGYVPMNFWWTNRGPAYCHEPVECRLRLVKDGKTVPVALNDHPVCVHLGDRSYNEIVRFPETEPGVYRLEFALSVADGTPLLLAHSGRTDDGYYYAGEIEIDLTPRPEFQHVWDDYNPDGYYPLEDPKVPG